MVREMAFEIGHAGGAQALQPAADRAEIRLHHRHRRVLEKRAVAQLGAAHLLLGQAPGGHIDHHAEGGNTDTDRGILLCRFHHMALHDGGWRITRDGLGDFVLHPPRKDELPAIEQAIERSLQAWPLIAAGNYPAAQQQLHKPVQEEGKGKS